jgi:hypothetical protein
MSDNDHPDRPEVTRLDPDSESGKRVAAELGELIGDVEDRLAREAAERQIREPAVPSPAPFAANVRDAVDHYGMTAGRELRTADAEVLCDQLWNLVQAVATGLGVDLDHPANAARVQAAVMAALATLPALV